MTSTHEYLTRLRREVEAWPGVSVEFTRPSKHRRAVLSYDGRTQFVAFPSTPGDSRRGPLNTIKDIRQTLRRMGATRTRDGAQRQRLKRILHASPVDDAPHGRSSGGGAQLSP